MKKLCVICIALILIGCPTYDPPDGMLSIKNTSSETVYVYLTCSGMLPETPELKLYLNIGNSVFDEAGNKVKDTIYFPNYRIEPDSIGFLGVWGTPKKPKIPCETQSMNLFFISEFVMRKYTWEEIAQKQLYEKKMIFTQRQLDSLSWRVVYKQD